METRTEQIRTIIESYINGQFRQATKQIEEMGVYDFACELEHCEDISTKEKLEIVLAYLRIKNR